MSNSEWVIPDKLWVNGNNFYKHNEDKSSTLLIPANSAMPFPIVFIVIMCSLLAGGFIGGFIGASDNFGSNAIEPIAYSKEELNQYFIVDKTIPTEIKLIIASKEYIKNNSPTAFAYAHYSKPCTIYFPSDIAIAVYPKQKKAEWLNKWHGDVLAHEIMHCIRGAWHKD